MSETHEKKTITIVVEGTDHEWPKTVISYAEVAKLEFPDFDEHPERNYSIKYSRGHGDKPAGILSPGGEPVKVKDGMIFNVSPSGQS